MNLEQSLKNYRNLKQEKTDEEKINAVIAKSKEAYYAGERELLLNYREFLWIQLGFIRKKWWIFQACLLAVFYGIVSLMGGSADVQKELGVGAVLFIVLIVPELWKNQSAQSLEIEGTCYYSLRQVYAARMLMFALVDVFLLSVFGGIVSVTLQLSVVELIVQVGIPASITACICFSVLCGGRRLNEVCAVAFCLMWSAVWTYIILDEQIYALITVPVWFGVLGAALIYMAAAACRMLNNCDTYWEVKEHGIKA